jgi:hypothetical protein
MTGEPTGTGQALQFFQWVRGDARLRATSATAVSSVRDGFWRSQQLVYLNASGRFSVAIFYGVVTRFGRWAARTIAVALMIAWILAAWRATRHALPEATPYEQIAAGVAFVGAIVAAAPDSYQPLIWTGGLATYGIPVVCATIIRGQVVPCDGELGEPRRSRPAGVSLGGLLRGRGGRAGSSSRSQRQHVPTAAASHAFGSARIRRGSRDRGDGSR